jgi:hypothetical protein
MCFSIDNLKILCELINKHESELKFKFSALQHVDLAQKILKFSGGKEKSFL